VRRDVLNRWRIVIAIRTTRIGLTKLTTKRGKTCSQCLQTARSSYAFGDVSFTRHGLTGRIAIESRTRRRTGAARSITSSARVAKAERSELVLRCEI
jgi:hypothetical protein